MYKTGKNAGRVCEKSICSKGIGKGYLIEENIKYHNLNVGLGYMDYEKKGYKEKPLPRYYRDRIYNPLLNSSEKIIYFEERGLRVCEELMKKQVRKYRENDDDYEEN